MPLINVIYARFVYHLFTLLCFHLDPVEHVKLFVEPKGGEGGLVEYPYGAKINFTEGAEYHFR